IAAGLLIVILLPLLRATLLQPMLGLELVGWPGTFNSLEFGKQLLFVPLSLFARSLPNPTFNLGQLPLLDVFAIALLILGTYTFVTRIGMARTRLLVGFGAVAALLIALDNNISNAILIP